MSEYEIMLKERENHFSWMKEVTNPSEGVVAYFEDDIKYLKAKIKELNNGMEYADIYDVSDMD